MTKILIVEDDESVRILMEVKLKKDFEIFTAEDGKSALELLENVKIDLLLIDVMMPIMDGYTLIRTLRNENNQIPAIMITAKSEVPDKLKGFAEVLKYEELSKEEQSKYLDIIEKESSRLANLSEKVLFLSKLNSQSVIKDKIEYDLDEQIKKCVILLQKSWEEKNIVINLDLEKIKYYNNNEIMNQVWINLINNSIKYTPENGQINIKLKSKKEKIIFEISDNGIGIEKEKISYIFNEYYQCDTSHKTKGVGLSIVKRILNLSDATISVRSIINERTTFIVTLPI